MSIKKIKARIAEKKITEFKLNTDYIKLDSLLKAVGAVNTGGHAKIVITDGEVSVNGEVCTQRGKKIRAGDTVQMGLNVYTVTKNDN